MMRLLTGAGEGCSTKTIAERRGVPGIATVAAATAVAATATARVLSVTGRVGVGATATRITRRSASVATVGQSFDGVVDDRTKCRVCEISRSAGNSFSLRTICCKRREGDVIVWRTARTTVLAYGHRHL